MDLTQKKTQFSNDLVSFASRLILAAEDIDSLVAAYSVNHFAVGDTQQIVDGDYAIQNTHLSQSIVADVMFALGTLQSALTVGIRNSLREAIPGGLP
jgi:hypothetical protein